MGELLLCRQGIASMPYFLENAGINVYSMEELCYHVLNNLYLVDRELISEELCVWIERELKEPEIADRLREIRIKGGSSYQFIMVLLMESGYCAKEELAEADRVLKLLQNKSEFQCRKLRADRYLEGKKYAKGIGEYTRLLEDEEITEETEEEVGNVWHNLGCAYAGLFLYEEAENCFMTAFQKNRNPESERLMLLCRKLTQREFAAGEPLMDEEVRVSLSQARDYRSQGDLEGYFEEINVLAENWKNDYEKYSRV